jgi:hypothetical protein
MSAPGGVVYDPFSGRGTTAIEAVHGRRDRERYQPVKPTLTRPRRNSGAEAPKRA